MTASDAAPRRAPLADAWLVAAGATAATFAIVALAPTAATGDPTVEVVTQVLLALAVGAAGYAIARRFPPDVTGAVVVLATGLFLCGGAAVLLNATPFAPLGVLADQSYRTAYLTKFGDTWGLVDYAYKDLPAFYPPLFFWVLGRVGSAVGVAPWEMLKIGMLAVAFLVPTAGWLLWRPVVGAARAAVLVVVTSVVFQEWYVPQLWLAIVVFVPWWLHFVLGVGRAPERRTSPGALALGIALGAVVALTYWYVLLIGGIHLVALLALRRTFRRHGRPPEPTSLRDAAWVLGGVAVVTLPYWVPVAVSVLTTPGAQTMQNRYFTAGEVSLPLPFLGFDLEGVVLLGGLVTLVATAHRRRVSMHLLGLLAAAYVLYLVGYLGFLADYPLDTLRTEGLMEFVLGAGAGLGAADLWRTATRRRTGARLDPTAVRAVLAVGGVLLVFAFGQRAVRDIPFLAEQRAAVYPASLLDGFTRATDGDFQDAVVLTDVTELYSFLPVYVFNTSNAHYSHPAALFEDRSDYLSRLADEDDEDVFELAFLHNRYDDIDLVALRESGDGLDYQWLADDFPRGVAQRSITFPEASFSGDAFSPLRGSGLTMYGVDRRRDPLRPLRDCPDRPAAPDCEILGPLLARYGEHLDDDARALAEGWRARR